MPKYYRKQIFQNNQLISTIYLDKNGVELHDFIPSESDAISPMPPPFIPDWGAFNRGMRFNKGYIRLVAESPNKFNFLRLETFLSPTGYAQDGLNPSDYPLLKVQWDEAIFGLSLSSAEVESWNALALDCNMPFSFNSQGEMTLDN